MNDKAAIRRTVLQTLSLLSEDEISQKSAFIIKKLLSTVWWQEAELVCLYYSMPAEVSTADLFFQARTAKKTVAAPRITGKELIFYDCTHPESPLVMHNYGMKEPAPENRIIDFEQIKEKILIIVPGVAFDNQKNRLGRGKGYYDKFTGALQKTVNRSIIKPITCIGLCFSIQLINRVPVNAYDQPVHTVITEDSIIE